MHQRGFHQNAAAFTALALNRMDGVGAQIQHRLLHLGGIGQHRWQARLQLHVQLNGGGQGHAQQALGVVHHFGQRHGGALWWLVAAEGKDLPHQVACAAACLVDFKQALQHR